MVYVLPSTPSVLPFAPPTLADALTRLRQDIFDQVGSAATRWADADLARAIDRALDQYSFVVPWLQTALVPAVSGSRLYTLPQAVVSPPQPAWWVEDVEYPTGFYPRRLVPFRERLQPSLGVPSPIVAAATTTLGTPNGAYSYVVTFLGVGGETAVSVASNTVNPALRQVSLTLPLGPVPYTSARNIYRTAAGGSAYFLLASVADNTTTTYVDNLADGALGAAAPTADSTASVPVVELSLANNQLPGTVLGNNPPTTIAISYASKHVLGAGGTTVPEQHHDIVLLGAAAYACLAFQVPTNDLFEYQDGELRDRVSEVKTPEHWLALGKTLLGLFKERLEEVKRQRDAGKAEVSQWGSVPSRWQWT